MVLNGKDETEKTNMLSGLDSGVSAPEVIGKTSGGDGFLTLTRSRRKKKVNLSEKKLAITKSEKAFDEMRINDIVLN